MGTVTKTYCDIKGCELEADHKQKMVSIRFTTEQEEGRSVPPYLTGEKLDFCTDHYIQFIESLPLTGSGAQGFNEYEFKGAK